ncbi:YggS family pyridoxal phosphate-dependent enzyme [Pseudochryseolinea flava]|uniref:Pyridoxal phosphate homeostasis protein n=1 Tax=Pseudochryseolinea flava TaxID=2059302 RepID=A0A364XX17_9BACT|nr:YggS family pyridoxal phosphate-dependent enzyme [Pseudochryseolinea flava]RAV98776.1 YggS family pyridoxal phosphate-dependent enzyme [Pseudochryseolinea flava]
MNIKNNINNFRQNLPERCNLIAVSKTQPISAIQEAYDAGQRVFGENKVQELVPKFEALPKDIQWHMIGHLQSNKVKYIAPFVHWIHAVDSVKLLDEINKQANKAQRVIACLLQVHIATEETKFGFSADEIRSLLLEPTFEKYKHIKIHGLMGMATFTDNHDQVRREFKSLRKIFDDLKTLSLPANVDLKELSMGMSGDYKIAIEEGSTMIRIGTALFGERNYH